MRRLSRAARALRMVGSVALVLSLGAAAPVPPEVATSETLSLSSALRLRVLHGRGIVLELRAEPGEDWPALAARASGSAERADALAAWNRGGRPGAWVAVPLALLSPELRSLALHRLFPGDRREGGDWLHVARSGALPLYDEGLWQVAEWFTGRGDSLAELLRVNELGSPELRTGQVVRIPASLLDPALGERPRSDDGSLSYGSDAAGAYATYRLKPGEALYSAVVVRFTGRTAADDVRAFAEQIATRNAITDLRDIPAGYEVKIPLELLEPDFLPRDHPRRIEADSRRAELARALAREPIGGTGRGLEGVWIVLDPGHGGRDLGTMNHGLWEHDYVYDVACRLKRLLEQETAARVFLTLMDMQTGCDPSSGDALVANRQGTILTTPPFLARETGESVMGVNLRWYLANALYRKALQQGIDEDRVLFVSLHADSRHPSLRGLMVYVPGADFRSGTHGNGSSQYREFAEVREKPQVRYSRTERVRSEAVSRKLAQSIVASFRRHDLAVQPYQPIREKVIRGKHEWLPAVLRGNAIPAKVLVEMVNLSNAGDAEVLGSATRREDLARALLTAMLEHLGERPAAAGRTAAR